LGTLFSIESLFSIGLYLGQRHVCLKYKEKGDTIDIICSVDRLKYPIMFYNPAGEESGNCEEPFRVGKGEVFCKETFNINQDLTKNTTTLIVKKNELMYGEWKCTPFSLYFRQTWRWPRYNPIENNDKYGNNNAR
jgi:hypothetical protein